jgi:hypothetical protein
MLREKLMCDSDVGLITYNWVEGRNHPHPNFNTLHKCRDFAAVQEWTKERQVMLPEGVHVTKTQGIVQMTAAP